MLTTDELRTRSCAAKRPCRGFMEAWRHLAWIRVRVDPADAARLEVYRCPFHPEHWHVGKGRAS